MKQTANTAARVVLTGASQGIGRSILREFARAGHSVLGLSRTKPENVFDSDGSLLSGNVAWKALDLLNATDVEQCAAFLKAESIRALILCAVDYGSNGRHPTSATTAQEWKQVIGTNCIGQCLLVSSLLPKLIANRPGIIVNISSDVAFLPGEGRAAYAASKAGLHAMLRAVAAEHPAASLQVYQLVPTFQSLTEGIRRRRPEGFDFSAYADPALIARLASQIVSPRNSIAPGTYLVRRDGTLDQYPEVSHL